MNFKKTRIEVLKNVFGGKTLSDVRVADQHTSFSEDRVEVEDDEHYSRPVHE